MTTKSPNPSTACNSKSRDCGVLLCVFSKENETLNNIVPFSLKITQSVPHERQI